MIFALSNLNLLGLAASRQPAGLRCAFGTKKTWRAHTNNPVFAQIKATTSSALFDLKFWHGSVDLSSGCSLYFVCFDRPSPWAAHNVAEQSGWAWLRNFGEHARSPILERIFRATHTARNILRTVRTKQIQRENSNPFDVCITCKQWTLHHDLVQHSKVEICTSCSLLPKVEKSRPL